jgi:N-acetylglutamate synthase-like GNAT family acetyltransferase
MFAYLCDHMRLAPELARLHYAEWGPLLPRWSEAEALAELRTHRSRQAIPTTMLMLDDADSLIGSVSLLQNDDERIRDYSPWLASLIVLPQYRGRGYGIALVERCVQEARAQGIPRLHLYTAGQQAFYTRLGWRIVDTVPLGIAPVDVMAIEPKLLGSAP